ncbi:MAG: hypothetical protein AAGC56_00890 [Pseudomonadota bacterium]
MIITPVGWIVLVGALAMVWRPTSIGAILLGLAIPMQISAAFILPVVGNSSVPASYVLVGALVAAIVCRPAVANACFSFGARNRPVQTFALLVVYAAASAYLMPRLFSGQVEVFNLVRAGRPDFEADQPLLRPTSGNVTQSVYLIGEFLFFAVFVFLLSLKDGLRVGLHALNAASAVTIVFGILSALEGVAGTGVILDFFRTSNYAILNHQQVFGLLRVSGPSVEPSSFGGLTVSLFVFNFVRYLQTRGLWHGVAASLLLLGVIASFSTTGYAALAVIILLWSALTGGRLVYRGLSKDDLIGVLLASITAGSIIAVLLFAPAQQFALDLYTRLFGEKLSSASGLERTAWTARSFANFTETYGLGVGLGSGKGSSHLITVIGNLGLIGSVLYLLFVAQVLGAPSSRVNLPNLPEREAALRCFRAARAGCVAQLVAASVSGTMARPGLLFLMFAAISVASLGHARRALRRYANGWTADSTVEKTNTSR